MEIMDTILLNWGSKLVVFLVIKTECKCPGWCGSVGWVSSCKPKGHGFVSQSGHMPGLLVQSLTGVPTKGNQLMFLSHSLPPPLSKIHKRVLGWGLRKKLLKKLNANAHLLMLVKCMKFILDIQYGGDMQIFSWKYLLINNTVEKP